MNHLTFGHPQAPRNHTVKPPRISRLWPLFVASFALAACAEEPFAPGDACVAAQCADVSLADKTAPPDESVDAGEDAGLLDSATDASTDAEPLDTGLDVATLDAGTNDVTVTADVAIDLPRDTPVEASVDVPADRGAPAMDARADVVTTDAAFDAAFDALADARPADVRDVVIDTGVDVRTDVSVPVDRPATGGCISGATGTHVVRFRWTGSGPNTRASVNYEANTLPDTSRWRVTANSMSIGYSPVFTDTFLGAGGLELSGTVFIDVELSTVGLGSISNVTLAILGRSFNTTASGSFTWQTFAGMGAAPSGLVANSAPYEWYRANATAAFTPGDGRVLLRIRSGPPSGSLVVNRVEVCFNTR